MYKLIETNHKDLASRLKGFSQADLMHILKHWTFDTSPSANKVSAPPLSPRLQNSFHFINVQLVLTRYQILRYD